jgi:hypothetical protein
MAKIAQGVKAGTEVSRGAKIALGASRGAELGVASGLGHGAERVSRDKDFDVGSSATEAVAGTVLGGAAPAAIGAAKFGIDKVKALSAWLTRKDPKVLQKLADDPEYRQALKEAAESGDTGLLDAIVKAKGVAEKGLEVAGKEKEKLTKGIEGFRETIKELAPEYRDKKLDLADEQRDLVEGLTESKKMRSADLAQEADAAKSQAKDIFDRAKGETDEAYKARIEALPEAYQLLINKAGEKSRQALGLPSDVQGVEALGAKVRAGLDEFKKAEYSVYDELLPATKCQVL